MRQRKLCKKPGGRAHSTLSRRPWDRSGSVFQRLDCHGIPRPAGNGLCYDMNLFPP
ncbi:hypothetical protein RSAG8_10796, partial [Rhizoctonia solani AG-8 WAC10335]